MSNRAGGRVTRLPIERLLLLLLAVSAAQPGLWALAAPRSFYDDFPGLGLHWVADLGPYNEHLVRDIGGFYLALAVLSMLAARSQQRPLLQATAITWLVFQVPHLLLHLHLAPDYRAGTVLQIGVLAAQLAAAIVLLVLTRATRRSSSCLPSDEP